MKSVVNPRFGVLLLFIVLVAGLRVMGAGQLTPLSNVTPVGAMALFGGAYFGAKWKAYTFPLLTLLVSDLLINTFIFRGQYGIMYNGWYWIYGVFALLVGYGQTLLKTVSVRTVAGAAVLSGLSYWLLVDFSVWLGGGLDLRTNTPFTRDWAGLQQTYIQGFPYMRNFLAGTLGYGALLFGGFEWLQSRYPRLSIA